MICVGKPSGQSPWELCRPKIHNRQLGRRYPETLTQLWSARSSLDFPGSSSNWLQNLTLLSYSPRLSYAPALEFGSWTIIDLIPQDATLADSRVYSFKGRNGNPLQQGRSSFVYANYGQNIRQPKEQISPKRKDTKIMAEKISNRPSKETTEFWENTDKEDYRGIEGSSMWDSNAETVRRRGSKRKYSAPEVGESQSWQRERDSTSQRNKWDYDSEPEYEDKPRVFPFWQWWDTNSEDDSSEDGEDDEDEDASWLSWLNPDIKDGFLLLRWGLPAAFVLCTALLPSMIGSPFMLFLGFSIIPSTLKFLNPFSKKIARSVANFFESWSPEAKRKRNRPTATYASTRYSDAQNSYGPRKPSSRSYGRSDYEVSKEKVRAGRSGIDRLGGWEDLVEDRATTKPETRWPLQKQPKLKKKLVKRDRPLIIRFLLALFPFLRKWGGLL